MDIIIISVGKIKDKNIFNGILEYKKRLNVFTKLSSTELKSEPINYKNKSISKKAEGERILIALEKFEKSSICLLTENGHTNTSLEFSEFINRRDKIVFVIAGALGFSEDVLTRGYSEISLSKLTFPHEMAQLILYEQIYRAFTIIKGKTYHY